MSFVNFQRINDFYKVELADTEVAWTLTSLDDGDNEENAITWASSATLAVSAAALVLGALAL
jgi:hypothetical protein